MKKVTVLTLSLTLAATAAGTSAVLGNGLTKANAANAEIAASVGGVSTFASSDFKFAAVGFTCNPTFGDLGVWSGKALGLSANNYIDEYDRYGAKSQINAGAGQVFNFGDKLFFDYANAATGLSKKGNIVSIPDGYLIASSTLAKQWRFAKGAQYICKVEDGGVGDWSTFIAPTSLSIAESTKTISVGGAYTVTPTLVTTDTSPLTFFKSSDTNVATIDDTGAVTAINAGSATITAYSGLLTATMTLTVEAAKAVTSIAVTNTNKEIHSYVGNPWNLVTKLTANATYDGGGVSPIVITDDMISGDVDITKAGTYNMTLTYGGQSDTFKIIVENLPELAVSTDNVVADQSGWGGALAIIAPSSLDRSQYVNLGADQKDDVRSHILINGEPITVKGIKNLGGARYIIYSDFLPKAGDTVEITKGLKLYQYTGTSGGNHDPKGDGEFYAVMETKNNLKIVATNSPAAATGAVYASWTADPTDFTITAEKSFVSVGEGLQLTSTITPEGAYGTLAFTSSDTAIATVNATGLISGVAEGSCTITAKLGEISHEFALTVTPAKAIKGISYTGVYNYYSVVKGSDVSAWKPEITKAKYVFEDDTTSPEFNIKAENLTVATFSTETVGDIDVTVAYAEGDKSYNGTVKVNVYDYIQEKVKQVGIVSWFDYCVFIQCGTTSLNTANLTDEATGNAFSSKISYTRKDGTVMPINTFYQLGANIAIFPKFLYGDDGKIVINGDNYNTFYLPGDRITMAEKTPLFKWTGDIFDPGGKSSPVEGTGEIIVEGYIEKSQTYRYTGSAWTLYAETTELVAKEDTINLKLGKTSLSGISRGPEGATSGTITFASENEAIATVNATNGVIKAVGVGETNIVATWKDDDDATKTFTKSVHIVVSDYEASIEFSAAIDVKKGGSIDLTKTDGKIVFASGKKVAITDWTGFTITGFDASTVGKQTVTISGTVNGNAVSGKLTVNVKGDSSSSTPSSSTPTSSSGSSSASSSSSSTSTGGNGGGCGGAIAGTASIALLALAGVVGLAIKRRKNK